MEIKTKFDIGQKVWLCAYGYRVCQVIINGIEIYSEYEVDTIYQIIYHDLEFAHSWELFTTKEEAEQALKLKQEVEK